MNQKAVTLDDKYTLKSGRVFISGVQALVRLPLLQKERDESEGLNTAGYISGYRGSPIGGYDHVLWQERERLQSQNIRFEAGMNEDMAATAAWGTQQLHVDENALYDGVFSIWYGKGPGVDRSCDVLKHANLGGTSPKGGVLAIFGDDHPGKSSSVAHQSEQAMASVHMPVLYPATLQDYIDFGLYGWAMSRYSGCWTGFKCVNETIENTASVDFDPDRVRVVIPEDIAAPPQGVHFQAQLAPGIGPQQEEVLMMRHKLPMVQAFVRANGLDKVVIKAPERRLGIVAAGKSYLDVMQALQLLGIDAERAQQLGISVYKVAMIWPLEPEGIKAFAGGHEELLFVEEKQAFMEDQAAKLLYNLPPAQRPRITGKTDGEGTALLPADVQLDPIAVAQTIVQRAQALGIADDALAAMASELTLRKQRCPVPANNLLRMPYFCSGCPHNRSTRIPAGSKALSGIGCHAMAGYIVPQTARPTHMGGEGGNWIGMAPFTKTQHVFQNLGDGTYSHSGLMALRAAVLAKTNITFKILFNDAVAMTGGQPVEGQLTVPAITQQVASQGVKRIAVVTDESDKYPASYGFAEGVKIYHRDDLDLVQREFRDIEGVTVIVNDQTCAAEKRRRRKQGKFPDPAKRAFINSLVCEGCGDCSQQSNCVSIQPKETELGRKRQIDQSSCNKDYSCVEGFCPSFVTVHGGELRKPEAADLPDALFAELPLPPQPAIDGSYGIMIAGIGGTGVVTIGAVLGMAGHLEDKGVSIFDMTGLAQKGGAVYSHLRLARSPADIHAPRLGAGDADLLLGCDIVAAGTGDALQSVNAQRSQVVLNSDLVPTAAFQTNPDMAFDNQALVKTFRKSLGEESTHLVDATQLAQQLMGNTIAANMFLVGYAFQLGLIPLGIDSIEAAIRLNGVAVAFNLRSLNLGRLAAHDSGKVAALLKSHAADNRACESEETLEAVVNYRADYLTEYQNEDYAARYRGFVERVRQAEAQAVPGSEALTGAVARYLFKLMAYKDEYEVARLYTSGEFQQQLETQFSGNYKLEFNLAPPLLARKDKVTGLPKKRAYGAWIFTAFKLLKRLKGLRGTPWDIFGYTAERRMERQLIDEYRHAIEALLPELNPRNIEIAVQLASVPDQVRGFGHIKERHLEAAQVQQQKLQQQFNSGDQQAEFVEVKMVG